MKVVVTGSGGMLGSSIVRKLARFDDVAVFGATARAVSDKKNVDGQSRVHNITNDQAMELLNANEVDLLINCAFPRDDEGASLARGLSFTNNLFKSLKYGCSVINVSSQSVYSQMKTRPSVEDDPACPQSSYGVAKYASELMLEGMCKSPQFTSIRLASLLAPDFDARFVNKMVKAGVAQGVVRIVGANNMFGFLSVDDAADAICSMLPSVKCETWKSTYNLGPLEMGVSLKDIGRVICTQLGRKGYPCTLIDETSNGCETNSSINSNRFYREFRWLPKQSLEGIVSEIIDEQDNRGSR